MESAVRAAVLSVVVKALASRFVKKIRLPPVGGADSRDACLRLL